MSIRKDVSRKNFFWGEKSDLFKKQKKKIKESWVIRKGRRKESKTEEIKELFWMRTCWILKKKKIYFYWHKQKSSNKDFQGSGETNV